MGSSRGPSLVLISRKGVGFQVHPNVIQKEMQRLLESPLLRHLWPHLLFGENQKASSYGFLLIVPEVSLGMGTPRPELFKYLSSG